MNRNIFQLLNVSQMLLDMNILQLAYLKKREHFHDFPNDKRVYDIQIESGPLLFIDFREFSAKKKRKSF